MSEQKADDRLQPTSSMPERYPGEHWHNVNDVVPKPGQVCDIAWILDIVEDRMRATWRGEEWSGGWTPTHWRAIG